MFRKAIIQITEKLKRRSFFLIRRSVRTPLTSDRVIAEQIKDRKNNNNCLRPLRARELSGGAWLGRAERELSTLSETTDHLSLSETDRPTET